MNKPQLSVYWARRDLRINDNPALSKAANWSRTAKVPFLPLFILEDYMSKGDPKYQFGYPTRYFLARALPVFANNFQAFALLSGKVTTVLTSLTTIYTLTVFVNDDVYPDFYQQIEKLKRLGIKVEVCEDALSVSREVRSMTGSVYSIFTPFKNRVWSDFVLNKPLGKFSDRNLEYLPLVKLKSVVSPLDISTHTLESVFSKNRLIQIDNQIIDLADYTKPPKFSGWYMSEVEAVKRFSHYLKTNNLADYDKNRNSLELDAAAEKNDSIAYVGKTSKMSLALAWGLISSRTLLWMMKKHFKETFDNPFSNRVSQGALTYISELIWREFYRYQLFHHPELMLTEFQARFRGSLRWAKPKIAEERFLAWIKGETGYSIVDAAMHQLAETGWMHNRARMVVASVLTKNLGVNWRWGQEYFRAALIDLDEASNNGGWQWGASVGTDPKPIRIFNPELQAKNYDASGAYQKKWLGSDLTIKKVIEHKQAREEALERYGLHKK